MHGAHMPQQAAMRAYHNRRRDVGVMHLRPPARGDDDI